MEQKTIDDYEAMMREKRATWPSGPWDDEPNRVQWKTRTGLDALMVRNHMGAWCGYVGVPPGHPLHGVQYNDAYDVLDTDVHGGLTYSDACAEHICHIPAPGEPDALWWLGFDCAHSGDLLPGMLVHAWLQHASYRTQAYVRDHCERLAESIAAAVAAVAPTEPAPAVDGADRV